MSTKSKIAIGSEDYSEKAFQRYTDQIEIRSGTGYRLHFLYHWRRARICRFRFCHFLVYGTHSTPYRAIRATGKPLWKSIRLLCTEYILFPSLHQYRNGSRTNPVIGIPFPFFSYGVPHCGDLPSCCLSFPPH